MRPEQLEALFNETAKEQMIGWDLEQFKRTHSTLFKVVIESMDKAQRNIIHDVNKALSLSIKKNSEEFNARLQEELESKDGPKIVLDGKVIRKQADEMQDRRDINRLEEDGKSITWDGDMNGIR